MADENPAFVRLKRALANLSEGDLLALLRASDDLREAASKNPAFEGKHFEAEGKFDKGHADISLPLDEMLRLMKELNPAELKVISTLAPSYFDETRQSFGMKVSATWGTRYPETTDLRVGYSESVFQGFDGVSGEDVAQRMALFQTMVPQIRAIEDAKSAGDMSKAMELFEQAISLLKNQGISDAAIRRLRDVFFR